MLAYLIYHANILKKYKPRKNSYVYSRPDKKLRGWFCVLAYSCIGFAEDTHARQIACELAFVLWLIRIFDFVEDTSPRHNQANACFCSRLFVLWLRRRYFASEKMQASLLFSLGLYVSLSYGTIRRERGWTLGAGVGEVVGLQVFPPDAARDRRVGAGGVRHARTDAHRRRQVAALPAADDGRPGSVHSRHAAHRPYEGSGRPPAVARHSRRGRPFGHGCAPHRHSAGQLRLRRREVSLYRTRASGHGYVPPALAAHECRAAGRRRGALHIAVGLRLPTLPTAA